MPKKVRIDADLETVEFAIKRALVSIEDHVSALRQSHPDPATIRAAIRSIDRSSVYIKDILPKLEKVLSSRNKQKEESENENHDCIPDGREK